MKSIQHKFFTVFSLLFIPLFLCTSCSDSPDRFASDAVDLFERVENTLIAYEKGSISSSELEKKLSELNQKMLDFENRYQDLEKEEKIDYTDFDSGWIIMNHPEWYKKHEDIYDQWDKVHSIVLRLEKAGKLNIRLLKILLPFKG